jgi:hypothetical protein
MEHRSFILLIMNCKRYKHKAFYQKQTWLKSLPDVTYYHVIGDEQLETEYKFSKEDKILFVKTKDDYNSLPNKVISAYNAIYKTYSFDYIFKTDDDQRLTDINYLHTLYNQLMSSPTKIHYGGNTVDVKTQHISQHYSLHPELPHNLLVRTGKFCTGRFYFLSRSAVSNLIDQSDAFKKEHLEDYAVGLYLSGLHKQHMIHLPINRLFVDIVNFNV